AAGVQRTQHISVGRKRGRMEAGSRSFKSDHFLPAFQVPDLDGFLPVAAGRKAAAIGRKDDSGNTLEETSKLPERSERMGLPQPPKPVLARHRKQLPILGKHDVIKLGLAEIGCARRSGVYVDEPCGPPHAPLQSVLAAWGYGQRRGEYG